MGLSRKTSRNAKRKRIKTQTALIFPADKMEKLEFILRDVALICLGTGILYAACCDLKDYISKKYFKNKEWYKHGRNN